MAFKNGRGAKRKGDTYERDLADWLNQNCFNGNYQCSRTPLSGGGMHTGAADLTGTPGIHVEAKRVERVNIREALKQAETSLLHSNSGETPIVITRRNQERMDDSLCVLRLRDFAEFYSAWLREQGFQRTLADADQDRQDFVDDMLRS